MNHETGMIPWQAHHGLPPGHEDKSMRRFMVYGSTYTFDDMLEANAQAPTFRKWLRLAEVGDVFEDDGQGCTRVADAAS